MGTDFLELFDKGNLVELGLEAKNRRKIGDLTRELTNKFDPAAESKKFFELDEWEMNRLAFVVACDAVNRGLKTSQIRKLLNISTKISRNLKKGTFDAEKEIPKLLYLSAYTAGRHRAAFETLGKVLSSILANIQSSKDYKSYEKLHEFLQAVVAYHRLLGGRDY